jgi:hypothetical protein
MNTRDLIDQTRASFVANSSISPTREVVYTRFSDDVQTGLNAFVGNGFFTKEEQETLGRFQAFGGLALAVPPVPKDTVTYDNDSWRVVRSTKMGALYTVYCENKRHNGKPS